MFYADGRVENATPRLLFAGRMIEGKGAVAAARCVRTLVESGHPISATFIGDGPRAHLVDRELAACSALSLKRQSHLDQPGLAQAMRGADLLLFPSLHESLGLTMIEAVFCGALPVVRDNGAMREILPTDIADELIADSEVEFQRRVEALLSRDRVDRARLVQRLQAELVPRFDAAQIAEHLNHALLAAARGQSGDSARRAVL